MISPSVLADAELDTMSDAIIARQHPDLESGRGAHLRLHERRCNRAVLDIIIPERLRARHWLGYRQVLATGESRHGHGDVLAVPGIRKDDGRISPEFTIVPIRDEFGQMAGMGALMRDVATRFEEMRTLGRMVAEAAKVRG